MTFLATKFSGVDHICKNTSMVPLIKQCWIRPWVRKEKNGRKGKKRPGFATSSDLLLLLFCFVLYRSLNTSQDYACMALSDTSWVLLNILKYSVLSVFSLTNRSMCSGHVL